MKKLEKPTVSFLALFQKCVGGKHEPKRTHLLNCSAVLNNLESQYDVLGASRQLHFFPKTPDTLIAPVIKEYLSDVYKDNMVRNGTEGRRVYDKLLESARTLCPFCGLGTPSTLDHYLPKEPRHFPELSVAPLNLVPACKDCNYLKGSHVPISEPTQLFHPYYEETNECEWLCAYTNYSAEAKLTVTFGVTHEITNPILKGRFEFHFAKLALNSRYSRHAATELSGRSLSFRHLFESGGALALKEHLLEEARSRELADRNSWQAALYRCLSVDPAFHEMNWSI